MTAWAPAQREFKFWQTVGIQIKPSADSKSEGTLEVQLQRTAPVAAAKKRSQSETTSRGFTETEFHHRQNARNQQATRFEAQGVIQKAHATQAQPRKAQRMFMQAAATPSNAIRSIGSVGEFYAGRTQVIP